MHNKIRIAIFLIVVTIIKDSAELYIDLPCTVEDCLWRIERKAKESKLYILKPILRGVHFPVPLKVIRDKLPPLMKDLPEKYGDIPYFDNMDSDTELNIINSYNNYYHEYVK